MARVRGPQTGNRRNRRSDEELIPGHGRGARLQRNALNA